jgi:hypothetical protein
MTKTLRIAVVLMAVLFACAAAIAQTANAKKVRSKPDSGVAMPFENMGTSKAPPMMFRDPPPQAPPAPQQQAPKK